MAQVKAPQKAPVVQSELIQHPSDKPKVTKVRAKAAPTVIHPALLNEQGERQRINEIPEDYRTTKHKPLSRKDFVDESMFYELRARKCDAQAAKFREMATEVKAGGKTSGGKAAKRLLAMQLQMVVLVKTLKAASIDIGPLLATMDEADRAAIELELAKG